MEIKHARTGAAKKRKRKEESDEEEEEVVCCKKCGKFVGKIVVCKENTKVPIIQFINVTSRIKS